MYGLVNKAIEDLVLTKFGDTAWQEIKDKAKVDEDLFISNSAYPDTITYDLVKSSSEVLGLPADAILEAFGEYWVLYTAQQGYGSLFKAGGKSFQEFLINLPNFHSRVMLMFPELIPPAFECSEIDPNTLRLHYRTERPGLAPMVIGLLRGLGEMYDTEIDIEQVEDKSQGADHDEFIVRFQSKNVTA